MAHLRSYLIALFLVVPLHAQTMSLSSYYGAHGTTTGMAIATDSFGNAYEVGSTSSSLPCKNVFGGTQDAVVAKITSVKQLGWCTYIGANINYPSGTTYGYGITLDDSRDIYVVGMTNTPGMGTTGAYQSTLLGTEDAFVAELNRKGVLQWFTYLGTAFTSQANSVFVDSTGVYITGYTTGIGTGTAGGWPVAGGVSQSTYGGGGFDIAVAKLSLDGSTLLWGGYLGGSSDDVGYRLAVSPDGFHACLDGYSESNNYPTTPGAFQTMKTAQRAAVVTCVDPGTGATQASTYFGGTTGSQLQCNACAAGLTFDSSGNIWIVGLAQNETNFPITADALQPTYGGGLHDAFISELTPDLSNYVYSTWFGGSGDDGAVAPAFDSSGNLWIHGNTFSQNLPVTGDCPTCLPGPEAFQTMNGGPNQTSDAFLLEISPADSNHSSWWVAYSTYLGGSGDEFGGATQSLAVGPTAIWFTGYTESTNLPLVNAFDKKLKGTEAAFVAQFCPDPSCP